MFGASRPVPLPRRPLDASCRARRWYENELGWPTVPGDPLRLVVGVRYDVLDVPAEAGHAALRRLAPGSPVAVLGDRMRLLVAAGTAEELPGLLEWLEWGTLPLDLTAIGAGGTMEAPRPPGMNTPPRTCERDQRLPQRAGGALPPQDAGAWFCRGAGGSRSGEECGALPCETNAPFLRETDAQCLDEWDAPSFRETDAQCLHEPDAPSLRETDAQCLHEPDAPSLRERDAQCLHERYAPSLRGAGGSMRRESGGPLPEERGGALPCGRDASCFREAGGALLRVSGGTLSSETASLPEERDGTLPCGRDASCSREAGGALHCGAGASFLRESDGSVSRGRGGSLPPDGFIASGSERGGLLPRQAFVPSAAEADGAQPPEPGFSGSRPLPLGRFGSQGAAVWLRPPEPGCEVEASLPTLSALGGGGDAPDLVRLVNTVATQCHRVRLRRACARPPALRAQGR
ncbi:SCO3374 family protein [Streptomyces sp. HP-A2021]|uniref:SCO3374 family protein n=1 Tax=Streptomyces sp. HP-A2021 TaxID=2927875 RepID=UPI001FAF99E5|nr:SCO3374 family protein [Streptomyces sp. HP-A2021]UOB11138.1 SCO3374 family protein [Streptomyces sp. HP-A2021]